ncbi:IS1096 element passenger TnpR family protein [Arthrobacter sp. B1I2]
MPGSTMTLNQVHRVLQAVFGWEDMHLHRFTALEPFVRLRPANGEVRATT